MTLQMYVSATDGWSWERRDFEYELWVRYFDGAVWRMRKLGSI